MTPLLRPAGAVALAAFLAAGPAWAADPSPIPPRAADEIGPRVIDLGPAPGTRITPAGDTTSRFFVHSPQAAPSDAMAYGYGGGYPGLWGGDGTFSRRNPHGFVNRVETIGSTGTTANVSFRGPRQTFPGGGIASPGISNFAPKATVRSGFIGSGRR
jgi:hypothetical protein